MMFLKEINNYNKVLNTHLQVKAKSVVLSNKRIFSKIEKDICYILYNWIVHTNQSEVLFASQDSKKKRTLRTSSNTFDSGSVTVEAALVFPFFLFVMYAVLMFGTLLMTSDEVSRALNDTARHLAKEAYLSVLSDSQTDSGETVSDTLSLATAKYEFSRAVDDSKLYLVEGGAAGVALRNSEIPDESNRTVLIADYTCKIAVPFVGTYRYSMRERCVQKNFIGFDADSGQSDGAYVYVAEYGEVYHTNLGCSHISIRTVRADDTAALKGKRECAHCRYSNPNGSYVTVYGDCIHRDSTCSALKRTIYLVRKDQTGGMRLCSKCQE